MKENKERQKKIKETRQCYPDKRKKKKKKKETHQCYPHKSKIR